MEKASVKSLLPSILIISTILVVAAGAAYVYGRNHVATTKTPLQPVPHVILGTITKVEPLHVYLDGLGLYEGQKFVVLIHFRTAIEQLAPWGPGEKEKAAAVYSATLKKMVLKGGEAIPTPPQDVQLVPWTLDASAVGKEVGIEIDADVKPGNPLTARGIRPMTQKEIGLQKVSSQFPWGE
jgi:hypothetical protein